MKNLKYFLVYFVIFEKFILYQKTLKQQGDIHLKSKYENRKNTKHVKNLS